MTDKTIEKLVNILADIKREDSSLPVLFKNIDKRLRIIEKNSSTNALMLATIAFLLIIFLSLLWINSDSSSKKNNPQRKKNQEKKQAEYFRKLRESGKKIRKIGNMHTFRDE